MSTATVRRLDEVAAEPWKNGGGVTRTLACQGDAWRVSIAAIDRDGAYSRFPGMRRLSMILRGAGVVLRHADDVVALSPQRAVLYDGAPAWQASLVDGPCEALNVMVRADAYLMSAMRLDQPAAIAPGAAAVLLACDAPVRIAPERAGLTVTLRPGDYAVLADHPAAYRAIPGTHHGAPPILILVEPAMAGSGTDSVRRGCDESDRGSQARR